MFFRRRKGRGMNTVPKIQEAIKCLSSSELDELTKWFDHFESKRWGRIMREEFQEEQINEFIRQAMMDYKTGKYQEA